MNAAKEKPASFWLAGAEVDKREERDQYLKVSPKKSRRLAAMVDPGIESPVRLGMPKPVPKFATPAFSTSGLTVAKFAWLNTFCAVALNCSEVRSLNLIFRKTEKFATLVGASRREFRAAFPNGVPNVV